jgi:hypothetical protein
MGEVSGDADADVLQELVEHIDRVAEIPDSLRDRTPVTLNGCDIS